MASHQSGIEEVTAGRRCEGAPLACSTLTVCSGIAIAYLPIFWAVGGHGYVRTFRGDAVPGLPVACFLVNTP